MLALSSVPARHALAQTPDADRIGRLDALDPAARSYRHPVYTGYAGPHDAVISTLVPAFAALRHDRYMIVVNHDRDSASVGWIRVEVPVTVLMADDSLQHDVACNVVHLVATVPHLSEMMRLHVTLVDLPPPDNSVVREYLLDRAQCAS